MEFNDSLLVQRSNDLKLAADIDRRWMTFHCEKCNTVLGDGLSVCGEIKSLRCIVCLKVTNDVVVTDKEESGCKGNLAHCIFSSLACRCCQSSVGRVIHSTPTRLSNLRSMFLLHKPSICCYILNSSSVVKATSISFEVKPLGETMKEMRQKFAALYKEMSHVK